jgi:general secretion pathway protein I
MDSRRGHGYTLIEILAVLAIIGIAIALAQVRFARSPAQALEDEARRVAIDLEFARDEAMTQGCTLAWIARATRTGRMPARSHRVRDPSLAARRDLWRVSIASVPVTRFAALFTPSVNTPFELILASAGPRVLLNGDALGASACRSALPARRLQGFTLIEILVALAIVAIGLAAAVRATSQVTAGTENARIRLVASWVAQDRLAEHSARADWPAPGLVSGSASQGPFAFAWREIVSATADPSLRRIDIAVAEAARPDYTVARLTGYLFAPEKKK